MTSAATNHSNEQELLHAAFRSFKDEAAPDSVPAVLQRAHSPRGANG